MQVKVILTILSRLLTLVLFLELTSCSSGLDALFRRPEVVTRIVTDSTKDILAFYLLYADNTALSTDVNGTVGTSTVELTVPYDTDISALVVRIAINGSSVVPSDGYTVDFSYGPMLFTVTAQDGSTKDYDVTVNHAAASSKDISTFDFLVSENGGVLASDAVGTVDESTIDIVVPNGVDISALVPNISITGYSVSPADGDVVDFSNGPVIFYVTAADFSIKDYTVSADNGAPVSPRAPVDRNFNVSFDVNLTGGSESDFKEFIYTLSGTSPADCSDGTAAQTSTNITIPTATTTLKAISCDNYGNASGVMTRTYTYDVTPPAAPGAPADKNFNGTFNVNLTGGAEGDFQDFRYTLTGTAPAHCSDGTTAQTSTDITIPASTTVLKAISCDVLGNASNVTTRTYTYDATPPSAPGAPADQDFNVSFDINLTGGLEGDFEDFRYTLTGTAPADCSDGTTAQTSTNITIPASTTVLKTISCDVLGNASNVTTRTYMYDATPPSPPGAPVDQDFNASFDVNLTGGAEGDFQDFRYTLTGTAPADCSDGTAAQTSTGITIPTATTILKAISCDALGNASNVTTRTYTYDITAPAAPGAPADKNFNASFNVNLTGGAEGDFLNFRYTLTGTAPAHCSAGTTAQTLTNIAIPSSTTVLKAISCDGLGNASGVTTRTYTYDITAPSAPGAPADTAFSSSFTINLTNGAEPDFFDFRYTLTGTAPSGCSDGTTAQTSTNITIPSATTTLKAISCDNAGNASGVTTRVYTYEYSETPPWPKRLGSSFADSANAITSDSSGNIFITGYVTGDADLDEDAGYSSDGEDSVTAGIYGGKDIIIAKYAPDGSLLWAKRLGGLGDDEGLAIKTDSRGNVIVAGYVTGDADLDGDGSITPGGDEVASVTFGLKDIFITKFGPSGNIAPGWTIRLGGSSDDSAHSIAIDPIDSSVVVVGLVVGTVDLRADGVTPNGESASGIHGGNDIFVSKFNSYATYQWSLRLGGLSHELAPYVGVDSGQNVVVAGTVVGVVDLDGNGEAKTNNLEKPPGICALEDIFISKFASTGNWIVSERFGGASDDGAVGMTIDSSDNIIITGYVTGNSDLTGDNDTGDGGETAQGIHGSTKDIFITKFDSSVATCAWSRRLGGGGADNGRSILCDSSNNILLTGAVTGNADLNADYDLVDTGENSTNYGSTDAVLSKFNSGGTHVWAKRLGGADADSGLGITINTLGEVFGTGIVFGNGDLTGDADRSDHAETAAAHFGNADIFIAKFATDGKSSLESNNILKFDFLAAENTDFSDDVVGTINGTNIAVTVPVGIDVAALKPDILINGASVSPDDGIVRNFTNPVNYTVTASDNSSQVYTVTVSFMAVRYVNVNSTAPLRDGLSWATAYKKIQDGINAAGLLSGECEVWVAQGTYNIYQSAVTDTVLMQPDVYVYGGFNGTETKKISRNWASNTTSLNGNSLTYHVVTGSDNSILDGFTITNGNAIGTGVNQNGGGMLSNGSIKIKNCKFIANVSNYSGGALYAIGNPPTISDCEFTNNTAHDGYNEGGGGAINVDSVTGFYISSSIFTGNIAEESYVGGGGGIQLYYCSNSTITNCTFSGNSAGWKGGAINVESSSNSNISNCLMYNNTAAENGGGLLVSYSTGTLLLNSTLYGNTVVSGSGSGSNMRLTNESSGGNKIVNSIIWGGINAYNLTVTSTSSVDISYSTIQDIDDLTGITLNNVIYEDPLFVDAGGGDFHLNAGSPCIDFADGFLAPAADFDGNSRNDDAGSPNTGYGPPWADMGVFEY